MTTPASPIADLALDTPSTARDRRRALLRMAVRRHRPGTGSARSFVTRRSAMQSWPDLRALLADVRRAVGQYMPEDARDLETMIYLGRAEMAPPLG